MIEHNQSNGYDVIQTDIVNNFSTYINKKPTDIKTIIIVGAYIGMEIPGLLNRYPNCTIHAFEAYPKNYNMLCKINNPRVHNYNLAISDKKEITKFYELDCIGNGSLLKSNVAKIVDTIDIQNDRLDSFFNQPIDLLWVDVQGCEMKVLNGIDVNLIDSMFLEVVKRDVPIDAYNGTCYLDQLIDYLKPTHNLHSIGLDAPKTGGNAFWVKNQYGS